VVIHHIPKEDDPEDFRILATTISSKVRGTQATDGSFEGSTISTLEEVGIGMVVKCK
jgi:hypothetical protein